MNNKISIFTAQKENRSPIYYCYCYYTTITITSLSLSTTRKGSN